MSYSTRIECEIGLHMTIFNFSRCGGRVSIRGGRSCFCHWYVFAHLRRQSFRSTNWKLWISTCTVPCCRRANLSCQNEDASMIESFPENYLPVKTKLDATITECLRCHQILSSIQEIALSKERLEVILSEHYSIHIVGSYPWAWSAKTAGDRFCSRSARSLRRSLE